MNATASVSTVWAKRGAASGSLRPSVVNTGHERRGEAAGDDDVEQELGQHECGVVGVELGAGAVGPGEDPVTAEPGDVAREGQDARAGSPPAARSAPTTARILAITPSSRRPRRGVRRVTPGCDPVGRYAIGGPGARPHGRRSVLAPVPADTAERVAAARTTRPDAPGRDPSAPDMGHPSRARGRTAHGARRACGWCVRALPPSSGGPGGRPGAMVTGRSGGRRRRGMSRRDSAPGGAGHDRDSSTRKPRALGDRGRRDVDDCRVAGRLGRCRAGGPDPGRRIRRRHGRPRGHRRPDRHDLRGRRHDADDRRRLEHGGEVLLPARQREPALRQRQQRGPRVPHGQGRLLPGELRRGGLRHGRRLRDHAQ